VTQAVPDAAARLEPVFDDPADAQYLWRKSWGPLMRLHEDIVRSYHDGLRRCWDECGSPMAKDHILLIFDGYGYVRGPEMDAAAGERLGALIAHMESNWESRIGESWYDAEVRPVAIETFERLRKHPKPTRPVAELVAHLEDCIDAHRDLMGNLHWRMAAGAIRAGTAEAPTYGWPAIYAEITGRPEVEASLLIGGMDNEMAKTVKLLRALARLAMAHPHVLEAVGAGHVPDGADDASKRFRSRFASMLRRYGHRTGNGWGSNAHGFVVPTWNIDPSLPLQLVATYARSDLDAVEAKERAAKRQRSRVLREVRRDLASDPERLARFEDELTQAMFGAWVIEDHNNLIDQVAVGLVRDATDVLGRRLVRDGVIDEREDVMHLSLDEVRAMAGGAKPDVRAIVVERKREYARREALEVPEHIGTGEPGPSMEDALSDAGEGHVGNELRGVASSPGRYTGIARVRVPAPGLPDIEDGEILVAKDAGPDWTPIFAVLGAVVLDVGAIWQHAAVVAREFGLPAVTGTKVGTTVIADGQTITVDGDKGIVEL
jgi:phosphohistidine swiveling domain-containing protein